MSTVLRARIARVTCVLLALASASATSQDRSTALPRDYPSKPVRVLVGNALGGGSDITARLIAQKLTEDLGRTVLVENRPGASGIIAMDLAAQSTPDGYSLLVVAGGDLASAYVQKKVAYDVRKAYTPITQITSQVLPAARSAAIAREIRDGAYRLRESETGRTQLRLGRHRIDRTRRPGISQIDRRCGHRARTRTRASRRR